MRENKRKRDREWDSGTLGIPTQQPERMPKSCNDEFLHKAKIRDGGPSPIALIAALYCTVQPQK